MLVVFTVMRERALEAVVFDLDGTLIQSKIDYPEMRRRVMELLVSIGVKQEELSQTRRLWEIIRGGEKILRDLGLPPNDIRYILKKITEAMNAVELEGIDNVEPTRHVHEALEKIRRKGLKIGVATRSCNAYATKCIEKVKIGKYIDFMLARDDVEHPKPDPRHLKQVVKALNVPLDRIIFVGDTATDIRTAERAKVPFIGYLRNEDYGRRLIEAECKVYVDDLRKIIDLIEGELFTDEDTVYY